MDVLDLMRSIARLKPSSKSRVLTIPTNYTSVFNQLNALNLHAEVEEQTFYPAIRNCKNTKELVEVAQEEWQSCQQMLEEVEYLSPTSGEFKQKIAELKRLIQHHLHAEENGIFTSTWVYDSGGAGATW